MRLRDEVLRVLEGHTEGMTDAQLAEKLGKRHRLHAEVERNNS